MIEVSGIYKSYTMGKDKIDVLKNINFEVKQGDFIALKGVSGSGKTTLLNMIGALDVPDSGFIRVNGDDITRLIKKERYKYRARNLGFVYQNYNLIPELTVYENVEVPLLISKVGDRKNKIISIIERVGLHSHIHHKPYELSGGQMQRVSIARALVKSPPVVLADEPTANLDKKNSTAIIDLMKELNDEFGVTLIIATHDSFILESINTVYSISDGELELAS